MAYFLNSYSPLAATVPGRVSSRNFSIPPFVDGSIRREPDFEHRYPSISRLCRGPNFAPRLDVSDVVAYVTNKGNFGNGRERRLAAILRVKMLFDSHEDAAQWYLARQLPLPSNCMTPGNRARPLRESHRRSPKRGGCRGGCNQWDASYRKRAARFGRFVVCESLWRDLEWSAPIVLDEHFLVAFGRIPGLRNPGSFSKSDFQKFLRAVGVTVAVP